MRQLSSQDAAFLYAETPAWHMHVGALAVVDVEASHGAFTLDRARDVLLSRLPELPQFRWRLVDTPLGVDRPHWVEAGEIDPEYHLRRLTVPPPGDDRALDQLVCELLSSKLDRSRPLWECYYIDGMADGTVGVLTKLHHALVDGVSGAGLMEIMLDVTPEPRPPAATWREPIAGEAPPAVTRFAQGLLNSTVRTSVGMVTFAGQSVRQAVAAAARLRPGAKPAIPLNAPRTRLNGPFTHRRALGRLTLDLDRVLDVRRELGVKVNDVVLAMVTGALRTYLLDYDDLPSQPLVVQCPVSLRTNGDNVVGSKVGSMFVRLPTNVADPLERLHALVESTLDAKTLHKAVNEHRYVGLTETMSPGMVGLFAKAYTALQLDKAPPTVNLVVSNVPGPRLPLYVAGAPLRAMIPMGPLLLGMGVNVSVFSHGEQVDIGIFSSPELVPDPERIAELMEHELNTLESLITPPPT
jgi:WS/DGAT/MGAT family acyltransferase